METIERKTLWFMELEGRMFGPMFEQITDWGPHYPLYSYAYGCPHCGKIWLRRMESVANRPSQWVFNSRACSRCEPTGGQLITGGDKIDFRKMKALPWEVLVYEFEREYNLWQQQQQQN